MSPTSLRKLAGPFVLIAFVLLAFTPALAQPQGRVLYLPVLQATKAQDSILALTNPGLDAATVTLTARTYEGSVLQGERMTNPAFVTMGPSSQVRLTLSEVFGEEIQAGWVQLETPSPSINGVFILFDGASSFIDGAELATDPASRLIFPKVTTDPVSANRLVFINTSNQVIDRVRISLYESSGLLVTEDYRSLAPFAGFSGGISDLVPNAGTFDGYAVVETTSATPAEALIGFETYRHQSDIAAVNAMPESSRLRTGHLPYFASQAGYLSTLVLVNYGSDEQTVSISAAALQENGTVRTPSSVTIERTVPPNGRLEARVDELFGFLESGLITGFLRFQTKDAARGLAGYLELASADGVMLTTTPAQDVGYTNLSFSNVVAVRDDYYTSFAITNSSFSTVAEARDYYTSFAILNVNAQPVPVTVDALDLNGRRIATRVLSLAPDERWAGLLNEMLPGASDQRVAAIHVSASSPVVATEFFGSLSSSTLLASMPDQGFVTQPQESGRLVSARKGATVVSTDGSASLSVPPDALNADTAIQLTPLDVASLPKPSGNQQIIGVVQATPAGTRFKIPARLRFPVDGDLEPGTLLPLLIFNPATNQYEASEFTAVVDHSGRTASAEVSHFTVFAATSSGQSGKVRISSLNPTSGPIGASVTISGSGFSSTPASNTVRFPGQNQTAVNAQVLSASPTSLTVNVPVGAVKGKVYVKVGSATSNGVVFTVVQQSTPPVITALSPAEITIGAASASIGITGTGFDSRATVQYDGLSMTPAYVNSTALTLTLGSSQLQAGTHRIVVVNPGPVASNPADLLVNYPTPAISTVSPTSATTGASVPAAISGSGFSGVSKVLLGGTQVPSQYVSSTSMTATVSSSQAGTQVLNVSNPTPGGGLSNSVALDFKANQTPVVNAGLDQSITLPAGANLSGSATDDGLPSGSTLTVTWSMASGPGTVSFANAAALNTSVTFSVAGTYVLRLTASDGALSGSDDVIIAVNALAPTNQAPVVNAGVDQTITLPAGASLSGTATDDGLPAGSTLATTWSKVSGPGTVSVTNASALSTSATFSVAGTYVLRLTATDSALSASDDVTVVVNAAAPTNQAPVVNAGPDQTITLPAGANLSGAATDDGLPTGSTLTKTWTKVSGPGTVTFGNASTPATTATFSASGTYVLRLTASDDALSTTDDVSIVVSAAASYAHWGSVNVDAESITMMAGALALEGQPNWYYYNGGDAPEGAYMGWLNQAQTLSGIVHLPQQLSPGRYYVFFHGISYDSNETIQASIGGAVSTSVVADDRDATTKYWTQRAVVDITSSSDTLQIVLTRNASNTNDQKYLFRGLYITSNALQTVTWDGVAVKLVYPTVMDDSTPVKGNLVPNGGFETGVDASWGFPGQGGGRTVPVNTMWDSTQGYEGQGSLKLTFDAATRIQPTNSGEEIISRVYHLKPNKRYTASMWVKTSPGLSTTASISLRNTYVPPPGYPSQYSISSGAVAVGGTWTRVSVGGYLLEYPTSDYQIYIDTGGPSGTYLSIDGVQLEEGDLTNYAAAADVEAALVIDMAAKPGNIYYSDETLSTDLVAHNNTSAAKTKTLRSEIYDHTNRMIRQESRILSIPANTTQRIPFDLSTGGKQGIFRVITWIENDNRTERELSYSVIPRPATTGLDSTSFLGIHANYTESQLKMLQRLGMKWSRVMSPSAFCRWNIAEPVDNQFVWYDGEVQMGNTYGITTMCTIGTNNYWPAWADNGGLPNLDKWQEFVGQLVAHYKPWIKHWEIWNESYAAFSPTFYAQMLKRAADAIEANDPAAKIVGMGGDPPAYIQSVITSLQTQYPAWDWKQHIDMLSTHDYPDGVPPEALKAITDTYGVPVWNTETGAWDLGFYQGVNSNFVAWGKNLWPHADASRYYNGMIGAADQVTQNFLRTIASGQTNYFYYDSRYYATPDYFKHHPTILEYDGTIRTKGIAYAIAGSLIDHSAGLGNATSDPNSYLLVFDKASGPVAALFSADKKARQITLSLNSSQFQVLDMMGNPVTVNGSIVPYGRIPVYVKGIGITAATLKSALQTGLIATRTDAVPPNVSISDGPQGPITGNAFRIRWIGLDDSSYPNLGEINPESNGPSDTPNPEAVLYSYRLNGYSDWSAWTARTYADFANLPNGSFTFSVKAKDEAGNESVIVSRPIVIGVN